MAKIFLTNLITNYKSGMSIRPYCGKTASRRENIRIQIQAQPFWERFIPHRKSPGMIGNLVDQQAKTMGVRGFASVVMISECLNSKERTQVDFLRKLIWIISFVRKMHDTRNIVAQTFKQRRHILHLCNGG